jgi:hypothetical protein
MSDAPVPSPVPSPAVVRDITINVTRWPAAGVGIMLALTFMLSSDWLMWKQMGWAMVAYISAAKLRMLCSLTSKIAAHSRGVSFVTLLGPNVACLLTSVVALNCVSYMTV